METLQHELHGRGDGGRLLAHLQPSDGALQALDTSAQQGKITREGARSDTSTTRPLLKLATTLVEVAHVEVAVEHVRTAPAISLLDYLLLPSLLERLELYLAADRRHDVGRGR